MPAFDCPGAYASKKDITLWKKGKYEGPGYRELEEVVFPGAHYVGEGRWSIDGLPAEQQWRITVWRFPEGEVSLRDQQRAAIARAFGIPYEMVCEVPPPPAATIEALEATRAGIESVMGLLTTLIALREDS